MNEGKILMIDDDPTSLAYAQHPPYGFVGQGDLTTSPSDYILKLIIPATC